MNIQRKNSALHFRMQSEREQTLVTTTYHLLQWLSQYTLRVCGKISFSFSAKPKIIQ